ncbi:MAG: dTMP kinase [Trueperaceae bacterium]|nr:dTMP kinase [Trueperaceae bacterium]
MSEDPAPGRFIVFEGPEGAGKSTQIARLAARLRADGHDPVVTREPGGTPAGDRIRSVLLDPDLRVDAATEFLLYAAARAQHVSEVIGPALAAGRVVLSDRFAAASVAYQGYGRGLDLDWIHDVNARVTAGLRPDLIVLLDLEPSVGLTRVAARGLPDRLEVAELAFHLRVRDGFAALAAAEPDRWRVFDAREPAATLEAQLWRAVAPVLEVRP